MLKVDKCRFVSLRLLSVGKFKEPASDHERRQCSVGPAPHVHSAMVDDETTENAEEEGGQQLHSELG